MHLHAACRARTRITYKSALDLDTCLGNVDGKLVWGKLAFSSSARMVSPTGTILNAELQKSSGSKLFPNWVKARVDLNEQIGNVNSVLTFVGAQILSPTYEMRKKEKENAAAKKEINKFEFEMDTQREWRMRMRLENGKGDMSKELRLFSEELQRGGWEIQGAGRKSPAGDALWYVTREGTDREWMHELKEMRQFATREDVSKKRRMGY